MPEPVLSEVPPRTGVTATVLFWKNYCGRLRIILKDDNYLLVDDQRIGF